MREGHVQVAGGKVWYGITGEGDGIPVLVLHGGPGFTHFSMEPVAGLAKDRQVIFYDQLGSGNSERPDDPALWTVGRFVEELGQVREALGLDEVHILGHSWGTMLAASYLLTQPAGVRSITFSSPCLSALRWAEDQDHYRKQLPEDVQGVLARHEANGSTDSAEYQDAVMEFYKRHFCRLDTWPEIINKDFEQANMQIYNQMWGPSEFHATGTLKNFDVTPRLNEIKLPALFLCGRYDESTPATTEYYSSLIDGAELHVFENSGHATYVEEPEEYIRTVGGFLERVEKGF